MESNSKKNIIVNTVVLYFRLIFVILVQLYTVPIVLRNLGISDYGIYNVVGGMVALFSFIGGPLASGAQRFFSFFIGTNDKKKLKEVFNVTLTLYLLFSLLVAFLLETLGLWFLNYKMTIPQDRIFAANVVFQFSIVTFVINYISIPYNALIIAHEKMKVFAYVSILECLLKLLIVIALQFVLYDKLIFYAFLLCLLSVLIRVIYQIYTIRNMEECRNTRIIIRSPFTKELLVYNGFNTIGTVAVLGKQQGLNVLLNLFFGVSLNAAHSVAQQVNNVINQFITNIYTASRPSITKLYAKGTTIEMWNMVYLTGKIAFILLSMIVIPLYFELPFILDFWLRDVPLYSVQITRAFFVILLIETLVNQLFAVFQSANRLKKVQLYSSGILLLNIPLSYLLLKYVTNYYLAPYIISVILSVFFLMSILVVGKIEIQLNVAKYSKEVIMRSILVLVFSSVFVYLNIISFEESFIRVLNSCVISVVAVILTTYFVGLSNNERLIVQNFVRSKVKKHF
jgi:O-antigen/teichoic acid export membrane protein